MVKDYLPMEETQWVKVFRNCKFHSESRQIDNFEFVLIFVKYVITL